jgi:glutathione S-transferase
MSLNSQHILYDVPVSNNGARCRIILYKKDIDETEVRVVPPTDMGGLKSEAFLSLNPQGKIPTLHCPALGFTIPESDTICRYFLTKYADKGPSFLPDDYKSNLLSRFHDMYLTTIQGCLYKDRPPFGIFGTRTDALSEFLKQLRLMDDLLNENDVYLCGSEVSLADATIFPTMVFAKHMLPKFGFPDALPSKIDAWFERVKLIDPAFKRAFDEVRWTCMHAEIFAFTSVLLFYIKMLPTKGAWWFDSMG